MNRKFIKRTSLVFNRFLGSDDPDSFFSRAQRSRMVYEILATAPFGKEKKGEVGIERLVDEGVYNAAFPLHDVRMYLFKLIFCECNAIFFLSLNLHFHLISKH